MDQAKLEQTLNTSIEELTGMKYQDFVEQAIFKAIGMNHSGYFALNKLPEKTAHVGRRNVLPLGLWMVAVV